MPRQTIFLRPSSRSLLLLCLLLALSSEGCSERRKEAARLEAELAAQRRGEAADPEPTAESLSDTTNRLSGLVPDSLPGMTDSGQSVDSNVTTVPDSIKHTDSITAVIPAGDSAHPATNSTAADSLSTSIRPVMPPHPKEGFTVQIAGTRSADEAAAYVERFKLYGYDPYIAEVSREGRPFYRVRLGKFATEQEAIELKNQLSDQHQIDGWVDQATF